MSHPTSGNQNPNEKFYWLDKSENVTRIVYVLYAACALLFLADFLYHKHSHFEFENWIGFYGWFGFISYVFIVMSAKQLRRVLHRKETYYDADEPADDQAGEGRS